MTDDDAIRTVKAIAGMVGCPDPFAATPREVYLRVCRCVHEREGMRMQLARLVTDADHARRLLDDMARVDDDGES